MNKILVLALVAAVAVSSVAEDQTRLGEAISKTQKITGVDSWYGFPRIKFVFNGFAAWVVEPSSAPAKGMPWTWSWRGLSPFRVIQT